MLSQNANFGVPKVNFLLYLFNQAETSPGTHPYPPIVRVGGTHGTIARAWFNLRRGDLGFGGSARERDRARERDSSFEKRRWRLSGRELYLGSFYCEKGPRGGRFWAMFVFFLGFM